MAIWYAIHTTEPFYLACAFVMPRAFCQFSLTVMGWRGSFQPPTGTRADDVRIELRLGLTPFRIGGHRVGSITALEMRVKELHLVRAGKLDPKRMQSPQIIVVSDS